MVRSWPLALVALLVGALVAPAIASTTSAAPTATASTASTSPPAIASGPSVMWLETRVRDFAVGSGARVDGDRAAGREGVWGIGGALRWKASGCLLAARGTTQGGRETFQILNGVRRSKAAEIAGKTSIEAEIQVGGKVVGRQEIALDALLSPKSSISTQGPGLSRWLDTLRQTLQGSKPPPITVTPGPRGTPIRDVLVE